MADDWMDHEIPQSRGVPLTVQLFFAIGVLLIIFMGAISAFNSKEFHVWPASDSAKVQLHNANGS